MIFKGKVDKWFWGVMLFVAAILLPVCILAAKDRQILILVFILSLFALVEIFCLLIALCNYVKLDNESLTVVFGLIKVKIRCADIETIGQTKEPWSSLAASFDRIKIQTVKGKTVLIALQDKDLFFKEIKKKNSDIKIM